MKDYASFITIVVRLIWVPLLQVVQILRGDEGSLELAKQCQNHVLQRTYSEELLDADEYNSTKYLNDMNRQMQIELEL